MTPLIWLLPLLALLVGLRLRSGRIRRLAAIVKDLRAEVAKLDKTADRLRRLARYRGLQTAMERARTRAAEKDAAEWKEIARLQLIRNAEIAEAGNERLVVRPPALGEPALAGIDMALYELEMDQ